MDQLPHLSGERSYSTCIYYLITPEEFSGLHMVTSTEIFHFYAGDPVEMVQIDSEGSLKRVILGADLGEDCVPQVIVEKNIWQGTRLIGDGDYAFLGCTVSPGFDFSDFTGGSFRELSKIFPEHIETVRRFTHK